LGGKLFLNTQEVDRVRGAVHEALSGILNEADRLVVELLRMSKNEETGLLKYFILRLRV